MVKLGLVFVAAIAAWQTFPICRALKENEFYTLKTLRSVQVGDKKTINDEVVEHKCMAIDDHGIEHIEATTVEGTVKVGDKEAESTKGEAYNYFQNSRGQQFEYEDIRATIQESPIIYMTQEIHSKLKEYTILPEETWKDKSTHTIYTITASRAKQFMKTECIEVIRKGTFTNGITGEFKEDSWYRTSDGQLMYQQSTADNVVIPDVPEIQYLERLEFVPNKAN